MRPDPDPLARSEGSFDDDAGAFGLAGAGGRAPGRPVGQPPVEIAGYRVIAEVARGSQGVVYRARPVDSRAPRHDVAIKCLARGLLGPGHDPGADARLRTEAAAAAALDHPGLVRLLGVVSTDQGSHATALIMEWVEGEPIDRWACRREIDEIVGAVEQACAAAAYAHRLGIVHRDLKPSNILVDASGRVRVLDFGLASRIGRVDRFAGTPAFAAPEHLLEGGAEITPQTDVFSLGAVLHALLLGHPPRREPAPAAQRTPGGGRDAPPELTAIMRLALHPDRRRRYASAEVLGDELRRFAGGGAVGAGEPPWRRLIARVLRRGR